MLTVHDRSGRVVAIRQRKEPPPRRDGGRHIEPASQLTAHSPCRFDPFDEHRFGQVLRDRDTDDTAGLEYVALPSSDADYCVWPRDAEPYGGVTLDWVRRCRMYRTRRARRELDGARAARHARRDIRQRYRKAYQRKRSLRFYYQYSKPRRLARTARLRYLREELNAYLRSCA